MRLNPKRKKLWICLALVVCMIFSVWISVIRFSKRNIDNLLSGRKEISLSGADLILTDFEETGSGTIVAGANGAVLTATLNAPVYISDIRINGSMKGARDTLTFRYTGAGEDAQEICVSAPLEIRNKNIYLLVDREVSAFSIEIADVIKCELKNDALTLNPGNLNCDYLSLVLGFLLPFLAAWLILEMICDWKNFKKVFTSLVHYRYLLSDLVSRDIKTKYRRSVLGILWSVLNPLLMMLVLTAVFSNIFRFEIQDFPVYYLTGYILFNFVSESTTFSMVSIIGSAELIKKVYIPKFIFPLEKCLFSLVNLMFSLIAAVIVFVIVGVEPHWTILLFPIPILFTFVFNFGFSLILATLNTFFRDVGYLYNVFITLWIYLTPIIYPMSILPGWMQSIVRLNPLYHYVEYFRAVAVYGTVPSLTENLICLAYSLIFLFAGILIFHKKQNQFIFYV